MKNILISTLNQDIDLCDFTDETNEFNEKYNNESEALTKYLIYKLSKENKTLDYIFLFVRKEDLENGNFDKFKEIFPEIPMDYIVIKNDLIKQNLPLALDMAEKITEYQNSIKEDIEISVKISDDFKFNSIISSLTEIIKYNEININYFLYANIKTYPHIIEEISEFTELSTIIKGTEDFIFNVKTDKLKEFFANSKQKEERKKFLDKMTAFSDSIRVCGDFDTIKNAVKELITAIDEYEKSLNVKLKNLLSQTEKLSDELKDCENYEKAEEISRKLNNALEEYKATLNEKEEIDTKELFFAKLLPRLKFEYNVILPEKNKKITEIDIIRLCLKTGLIQQAIIFYAEWLPRFLIENKYIKILDKSISEDCSSNMWSHWSNEFFRNYQIKFPAENVVQTNSASNNLHNELREAYNTGSVDQVLTVLNGRDKKLENFLNDIKEFSNKYTLDEASQKIAELTEDSMVKKLLHSAVQKNANFNKFIAKRLKKEKSIEKVLIKCFSTLPKNLNNTFYSKEIKIVADYASVKKSNTRKDVFKYLIDNKKISVSINEESLLCVIESYDFISGLRNKFAHAIANSNTVENQNNIAQIMEKSLDLIDVK
ncbi:MAG: TM1812 family CRISPR-associated protein [Selenomonadaceae bacterium]|nr:TM1812 family CRISPR-associated protein [Selenomonadaceae bacterium]